MCLPSSSYRHIAVSVHLEQDFVCLRATIRGKEAETYPRVSTTRADPSLWARISPSARAVPVTDRYIQSPQCGATLGLLSARYGRAGRGRMGARRGRVPAPSLRGVCMPNIARARARRVPHGAGALDTTRALLLMHSEQRALTRGADGSPICSNQSLSMYQTDSIACFRHQRCRLFVCTASSNISHHMVGSAAETYLAIHSSQVSRRQLEGIIRDAVDQTASVQSRQVSPLH